MEQKAYDWRWCGKAFVHAKDNKPDYWLNYYERVYMTYLTKESARHSTVNNEHFLVWGEIYLYEVKEVSELNASDRPLYDRTWGFSTPNSNWEKIISHCRNKAEIERCMKGIHIKTSGNLTIEN